MNYSTEQISMLENAIQEVYQDNLEFLEKYDNPLYKRILELDNKIKLEEHNSRYELEFFENSFNIYDGVNKKYLYDKNLDEYTREALKELDFTRKGSLSNISNDMYNRNDIDELRLFNDDIQTQSYKKIVKDINKFKKLFDNPNLQRDSNLKYIPSFVFFGTLLGKHLYAINQKYKCGAYMIIEPSIEIFRLSLFVTEYKLLYRDSRLFFSIGQNDYEMVKQIEPFILYDSFDNYLYKYYSTSYHDKQLFNNFTLALQNATPFAFDYYRQIHYAKKSISRINKYPVLIENKKRSDLQDLPILILSPGPSLRKNFKWLKKNQNKFITIAFGATVKALSEIDFIPDIITSVDASTLILKQFPKDCKKIYKDSIALLSSDSHPELFSNFKKDNIFIFEANFKLKEKGLKESPALTVGDNAMHILLSMGFKKIYMLGTDLFVDVDTGVSYDKSHNSSKSKSNVHYLKKNIMKISEDVDVSSNYIKVKSNLTNKTLYTNQFFYKIIESYSVIVQAHTALYNFDVYNLSNGAKINNIESIMTKDIVLEDIKENKKSLLLKEFFNTKSSSKFSSNEQSHMKQEIDFLNELISFVRKGKDKKLISADKFYKFRKEYAIKIVKYKSYSSLTKSMISTHIKIIDSYINFVFNDEKFKCSDENLSKIQEEWCSQVLILLKTYKNTLEKTQD